MIYFNMKTQVKTS